MNVNYINPFISAIESVLSKFGVTDIKKGSLNVKDELLIESDVTAFVGIVGNVSGNVAYSFSNEVARKIASTMMMGMPVEKFDEMSRSAIAELSNMFTGSAAGALSEKNVIVDITPPTVLDGEDVYFILSTVQTLTIGMETSIGAIDISIGLEN